MIFSSFRFLVFFPVVLALYYASRNRTWRTWLLLTASYVFYASWDVRFLSLIVLSTLVDYVVGMRIPKASTLGRKRAWLSVSLGVNLGLLGFFKYFNFFIDSFRALLGSIGVEVNPAAAMADATGLALLPGGTMLDLVLPVGISFYTFQTMSYSLDIYRGQLQPTKNLPRFALFVAFFPQLVAGPIVRAVELMPQLARSVVTRWDDVATGLNRFALGFTKKVLIADSVAPYVDRIFSDPAAHDGPTLWVASIGFATQCYCDFSGYSDMAIGAGRLMGFRLPENFRFPFTAVNVGDFWRRWHITLYSFMRDYLYFALGGSRVGQARLILNALLTMTLVGFWHGADWQFIVWGFYNGALIVAQRLIGAALVPLPRARALLESVPGTVLRVATTNVLFFISFFIFRSESPPGVIHSAETLTGLFQDLGRMLSFDGAGTRDLDGWVLAAFAVVLLGNMAASFRLPERLKPKLSLPAQCVGYGLLLVILAVFCPHDSQAFVYFQF